MSPAMRIGVLGGTFDPPHRAHLALAEAARDALALDIVIAVPAGEPWRKAGRRISSAETRLVLVEAAFADLDWVVVSDIEVRRVGPSYTADTLEALQAARPGHDWWFILGQDALLDLPHWHEPERIVELARLAVASRGDLESAEIDAVEALPALRGRIDEVPFEPLDVSASAIREQVAAGEEPSDVGDAVRALIAEHGLYGEGWPDG